MVRLSSENGSLDSFLNGFEHLVHQALRLHRKQAVLVGFFEHGDVLFVGGVTLADQVLSVLGQALQTQVLRFKLRRVDFSVEELTGHGVNASGLQFIN